MYGPEYPTCAGTFATFRVQSTDLAAEEITAMLKLQPSTSHRASARPSLRHRRVAQKRHGWFLSSEGRVESLDNRDHLDWLFEQLTPRRAELEALRQRGAALDIFCYWVSRDGHGGPALSPAQAARLVELNLEISYDIYRA